MTGQCSSIVGDLLGLWPTVCHGFSNAYFDVFPAVNEDVTKWLVFDYNYTDEVGPSTYATLAVPVAKLLKDIARARRVPSPSEVSVPIDGIPMPRPSKWSKHRPLAPSFGIGWDLSVVLGPDGHVVACIAHGTWFDRKEQFWSPPGQAYVRPSRSFDKEEDVLSLIIDEQRLAAVDFRVKPWKAYLPAGS